MKYIFFHNIYIYTIRQNLFRIEAQALFHASHIKTIIVHGTPISFGLESCKPSMTRRQTKAQVYIFDYL